jgi:NAD+ kinase
MMTTSMPGSAPPSADQTPRELGRVERAALVSHGQPERVRDAVRRLLAVAADCGVTLVVPPDEREKHPLPDAANVETGDGDDADIAVVLGGDGTTLRALRRYLGTRVASLGVNFGRVGFLTGIRGDHLEDGVRRAFAGEAVAIGLPTLDAHLEDDDVVAVNDVVVTSGILGRMVLLACEIDGEALIELGCDGAILATPTGSTAYNLSAGGPVLAWGTEGFVLSFVSPHSLHARPLVLGRAHRVRLRNDSPDVPMTVIVDGHARAELAPHGGSIDVRMGSRLAQLAQLQGTSFFGRYRETFSH